MSCIVQEARPLAVPDVPVAGLAQTTVFSATSSAAAPPSETEVVWRFSTGDCDGARTIRNGGTLSAVCGLKETRSVVVDSFPDGSTAEIAMKLPPSVSG